MLLQFSEAILTYVANLDRAPDKTITVARYSQPLFTAFEILFNVWLNVKEPTVRIVLAMALR